MYTYIHFCERIYAPNSMAVVGQKQHRSNKRNSWNTLYYTLKVYTIMFGDDHADNAQNPLRAGIAIVIGDVVKALKMHFSQLSWL